MGSGDDPQQFARLRALFDRIAELDPIRRDAVIQSTCGDDGEMERELRALLDAHDREQGRTGETRARLLDEGKQALASAAEPGERVGPFVLREVLGRGGMGVVYRAERADGEVRQQVAVKVLQRMHLDEAGVRRFAQERDIVAQLAHPGIARLFDAGTTRDGSPYYAMELVDGQPISAWCEARQLPIADRLALFLKVCDAVRFAHANLVLHRDIKPANVLVDANGAPKLIDFGIAKAMTATDATQTGMQLFSPSNAAPEQLRGERCGVACDVYQLGTLLYEMLAGVTVLRLVDRTPAEIEAAILHRMPARPSEVAREKTLAKMLRGDLDSIVLRALRKEPGERYASVEQLAEDIGRHLRSEPIAARGGERVYRLRTFIKRNRTGVALTALASVVVTTFVVALVVQARHVATERDAARLESARSRAVSEFLVDVMTATKPGASPNRDLSVRQLLDNGRKRLEWDLREQPDLRVPLLGMLAITYEVLGDKANADQLIALADAQIASGVRISDRSMAQYLMHRASLRRASGDLEGLNRDAAAALALQQRLGDAINEQIPAREQVLYSSLSLQDRSTWKPAILAMLREVEADPTIDPLVLAKFRRGVGHNLIFIEELELAEKLVRQALDVLERTYPPGQPDVMVARTSLAIILSETGNHGEAIELLSALLDEEIAMYGRRTSQVGRAMTRLGQALMRAGRHAEALVPLEEALVIHLSSGVDPNGPAMQAHTALGELSLETGRFVDAERHLREAVRIADAVAGSRSGANSVELRTGLADALARQGKLTEAERVLRECEPPTIKTPDHLRWAVMTADVLHRAGRDDEARALLARTTPGLAAGPASLAALARRADVLRHELDSAQAAAAPVSAR